MNKIGDYLLHFVSEGGGDGVNRLTKLLKEQKNEETFAKILALYGMIHWAYAGTTAVSDAKVRLEETEREHHYLEKELRVLKDRISQFSGDKKIQSRFSSLLCYSDMFSFPGNRQEFCRFYSDKCITKK